MTDENWPWISNTALVGEIQEEQTYFQRKISESPRFSKEMLSIEGASFVFNYAHFNATWTEDEVVEFGTIQMMVSCRHQRLRP